MRAARGKEAKSSHPKVVAYPSLFLVIQACGNAGGGALTWEMFEYSGAKIRALQGSERTPDQMLRGREFTEAGTMFLIVLAPCSDHHIHPDDCKLQEPNPVEQNQLMIIRCTH